MRFIDKLGLWKSTCKSYRILLYFVFFLLFFSFFLFFSSSVSMSNPVNSQFPLQFTSFGLWAGKTPTCAWLSQQMSTTLIQGAGTRARNPSRAGRRIYRSWHGRVQHKHLSSTVLGWSSHLSSSKSAWSPYKFPEVPNLAHFDLRPRPK